MQPLILPLVVPGFLTSLVDFLLGVGRAATRGWTGVGVVLALLAWRSGFAFVFLVLFLLHEFMQVLSAGGVSLFATLLVVLIGCQLSDRSEVGD